MLDWRDMPIIYDIDDFTSEDLRSAIDLDMFNFYDRSDPMFTYAQNIVVPDGEIYIVGHGSPTLFGRIIYGPYPQQIDEVTCSAEELADFIKTRVTIAPQTRLAILACYAGLNGSSSFAQNFVNALGNGIVSAPLDKFWVTPTGFYYICAEKLLDGDSRLSYDYQQRQWDVFTPR